MAEQLEHHYPGDEAWAAFVNAVSSSWNKCNCQQELTQLLQGQTDIAKVVFFAFGDAATSWVKQPVPALDGLAPVDCLAPDVLVLRLRSMLMRLPL